MMGTRSKTLAASVNHHSPVSSGSPLKKRRHNEEETLAATTTPAPDAAPHHDDNASKRTATAENTRQPPLSPRTIHNKAPQYSRTRIGDRNWQPTDPHQDYCAVCGLNNPDLIECLTCPKSFHSWCLEPLDPHSSPCPSPLSWFCSICIERGWHELDLTAQMPTPPITIPDSAASQVDLLKDAPAMITSDVIIDDYASNTLMNTSDESNNTLTREFPLNPDSNQKYGNGDPSTSSAQHLSHQTSDRAAQVNDPENQNPPKKNRAQSQSDTTTRKAKTSNANKQKVSTEGVSDFALGQGSFFVGKSFTKSVAIEEQSKPKPSKYRGTNTSRFPTLSVNADHALTSLFEELECTTALKALVSQLEEKVASLQNIAIQSGKDTLARQDNRKLLADNASLAADLASNQAELKSLQEKNAQLARALEKAEAAIKMKEEETAAWKSKMLSFLQP